MLPRIPALTEEEEASFKAPLMNRDSSLGIGWLSDDTRRSLRGEETDTQLSYHDMGPDTSESDWMDHRA